MKPLILALLLGASTMASPLFPDPVIQARSSAVQIMEYAGKKAYAVCSGARLKLPEGGRIVTAGHCVSDDPRARFAALDSNGKLHPLFLERWEHRWPDVDYAVFKGASRLPALELDPTPLEPFETVYGWCGPLGMKLLPFAGMVQGEIRGGSGELDTVQGMVLTTLEADEGASGSIVLDNQGRARAILVGTWKAEVKLDGSLLVPLP